LLANGEGVVLLTRKNCGRPALAWRGGPLAAGGAASWRV